MIRWRMRRGFSAIGAIRWRVADPSGINYRRLSSVIEDPPASRVEAHPSVYLRSAEALLGLENDGLALEAEFSASVDTPDGTIRVRLATFTSIDPPFELAERLVGKFIAITEARGDSNKTVPAEMELLRQAYTVLMG